MRQIFCEGENDSFDEAECSEKMSAVNIEAGSMNETADEFENDEIIDEVKEFSLQIPEFMTKKNETKNVDENFQESKKRCKEMRRKKRLENVLYVLLFIFSIGIGFILVIQFDKAFDSRRVTDIDVEGQEYFYRDIKWLVNKLDEEPHNRDLAWDSELPKFIEEDIVYMQKHEDIVYAEYRYKSYKFNIQIIDDSVVNLNIGDDLLQNYSLYKNGDSIIIYGEEANAFLRYELNQKYSAPYEPEIITNNVNVPISEKTSSVLCWKYNCYLCISQNQKEVFICDDGKVAGKKYVSDVGGLRIVDYEYIADADNNLFMPIIYEDESENLCLDVQKMGNANLGEGDEKLGTLSILGLYDLPVIKDGSNTKFFVPQNMKSYRRYIESRFPYDTDINLEWSEQGLWQNVSKVKLEYEYISSSALYGEEQRGWEVTFYYAFDDVTATYSYMLDGIDSFVILDQDETKSYEVYTEEEYWNIVSLIRNIYEEYYTQKISE